MLRTALERIASITGHTPSTSTTAPTDRVMTRSAAADAMTWPGRAVPEGRDPEEYDRMRRRVLWSLPTGLFVVGSRAGAEGT